MNWKIWGPVGAICLAVIIFVGYRSLAPKPAEPAAPAEQASAEPPPAEAPAPGPDQSGIPAALSADANQKFLKTNAAKPGVMTRPDGLQYRVITAGTGKMPTANDMVEVTYKGWLINGQVFDQTEPGKTAIPFPRRAAHSGMDRSPRQYERGRRVGIGVALRPGLWSERGRPYTARSDADFRHEADQGRIVSPTIRHRPLLSSCSRVKSE